jgi:hypothetical protein
MAAFSNYMEDAITAWINGTTFPSAPTNTYVQLYSQDPTDAGSATGALYTRVTVRSEVDGQGEQVAQEHCLTQMQ